MSDIQTLIVLHSSVMKGKAFGLADANEWEEVDES
jgi:hypothetical protein